MANQQQIRGQFNVILDSHMAIISVSDQVITIPTTSVEITEVESSVSIKVLNGTTFVKGFGTVYISDNSVSIGA